MASDVIWEVFCNGEVKQFAVIAGNILPVTSSSTTLQAVWDSIVPAWGMFMN